MNSFQDDNKPTVVMFSEPGGLALGLLENLLLNLCRVVIVSGNLPEWFKKVEHIGDRDSIKFSSYDTLLSENIIPNYIIFISPSVEPSEQYSNQNEQIGITVATTLSEKYLANSVFVFPYSIYPDINREVLRAADDFSQVHSDHSGILFLGELIGPRINLTENRLLSRLAKDIAGGASVRLPKYNFQINPVYVNDAAKEIIKSLFSFGGVGEKVAIISPPTGLSEIYDGLYKASSSLNFVYTEETVNLPSFSNLSQKFSLPINYKDVFAEIVNWYLPQTGLIVTARKEPLVVPQISPEKISNHSKSRASEYASRLKGNLHSFKIKEFKFTKRNKIALLLVSLFLIFPYLTLVFGGGLLFIVRGQLLAGNTNTAGVANSVASGAFNLSFTESDILLKVPLFGKIYQDSKLLATAGNNTTTLISRGIRVSEIGTAIVDKILTGNGKDISEQARDLSLETDAIYRELSFLESDLQADSGAVGYFTNKLYSSLPLQEFRDKFEYAADLAKTLPELLGENGRKTYMVLFQNNMELRPAGGFIGSFALVSFEKGKLTGFDVYDVYDADGQLKGHVEPPFPIKKYLGEAGWYLRDSNWDPDFTVSAQRAEWFLDKELDVNVDGVVSLDLEFVKSLVNVFGSVEIKDFGKTVNSENLYQITQEAAEQDFFPGSRQKSSFLTALTKTLLDKITNIEKDQFAGTFAAIYKSLESRHIQLYAHDQNAENAISQFGWDGAILQSECADNCYKDYIAMAEANVGVNKANYYITRAMTADVNLKQSTLSRQVTLTLKNSAPVSMGEDGTYKAYIRLLAPGDSGFGVVDITTGTTVKINPDITDVRGRKEAGVYVEIPAQSTGTIVYRWTSETSLDFGSSGYYNLVWRKQSGTSNDPVSIHISSPTNTKSDSALTVQGQTRYNTALDRDFKSHIYW